MQKDIALWGVVNRILLIILCDLDLVTNVMGVSVLHKIYQYSLKRNVHLTSVYVEGLYSKSHNILREAPTPNLR